MNKKKLIIIILIVVVLLGGGAAAYFKFFAGGDEEVELEEFKYELGEQYANVNLNTSDTSAKRVIVKYDPFIVYTDETLQEVLEKNRTEINTEFKRYFMSRTEKQLAKLERVQEDLTEVVKEVLEEQGESVVNVLMPVYIFQ